MVAIKDIKEEARKKLALNIHQAIVIYTVVFTVFITLIALIVMSCVSLGVNTPAAVVMICYGIVLCLVAIIGSGMLGFAMVDFYLASYRCKPYNIRRLGDILARCGITKILLISIKRTLLAFLLLLCLIVPGVIYLIRTSMANNLLIANPKMNASTALSASNKVMSGKTGSYFALCMSMIGWYILGIVTLGLGFVFILPYTNLVKAVYYKRNLQGDKTVYNVAVQPVVSPQQGMYDPNLQNAAQPMPPQQNMDQPVEQEGVVVAPIDALADDDMQDMTEAMRDFGTEPSEPQVVDVPEVPLSVTYAKTGNAEAVSQSANEPVVEAKLSKKDKKKAAKKNNADNVQAQVIDGTSLVATERELTTQEIDASDEMRRQAIEAMYAHTEHIKPQVNYFDKPIEQSPDDFFDIEEEPQRQAVEPIAAEERAEPVITAAPIVEPIVEPIADPIIEPVVIAPVVEPAPVFAEPITESAPAPVISDSDFDKFLNDFDNVTEQQSEFVAPTHTDRASAYNPDRNEAPSRHVDRPDMSNMAERNNDSNGASRNSERGTAYRRTDERVGAAYRRTDERIGTAYRRTDEYLSDISARASRRTPPDRNSVQGSVGRNNNGNTNEVIDRAERTRREREERLNKNNR